MGNIKYLIPQDVDVRWGLVTTTVGMQEGQPGIPYPYGEHPQNYYFTQENGRVLNEYTIVYILKGSGWFVSRHCERTEIHAGDAFLLFPGEWHNYSPNMETGWTEAWAGFTGHFIEHLVNQHFFTRENPVVHVGVNDMLWSAFDWAYKTAISQPPFYQQQLSGYVFYILSTIYARKNLPTNLSDTTLRQIIQAKQFMGEHSCEMLRMEDVAAHVGMGYSKFRKEFKEYTGFTPGEYFLQLKLAQCKDLLLSQNLSCKEIAFRMGFDSVTYFHQFFRRFCGITPRQFQHQMNQ